MRINYFINVLAAALPLTSSSNIAPKIRSERTDALRLNSSIDGVAIDPIDTIVAPNKVGKDAPVVFDKYALDGSTLKSNIHQSMIHEAHYSETELVKTLNKEDITLIKDIARNQPNLLKQKDSDGWNTMTKAASEGKTEVIKAIIEINPDLLKEQDGNGWNTMTKAANTGNFEVIKAIGEINPDLLKERDRGGCQNDQEHGQGTLTYANGDKYEGEWKDDHVIGKSFVNDSLVYSGNFLFPHMGNPPKYTEGVFYYDDSNGNTAKIGSDGWGEIFDCNEIGLYEGL